MGRLPSWGIGWYRRQLDIPAADAGKSIFLEVDGAMSYAMVWLNGRLVGGWPFGYASWRVDLTPYVIPGQVNQLAIRLDNPPASSRWYPGGGIYRNVWLTKTSPVHVGQWGVQVTTPQVSAESATIDAAVTLANATPQTATVAVGTEIYELDATGKRGGAPVAQIAPLAVVLPAGGQGTVRNSVVLSRPGSGVRRPPSSRTVMWP
jgi:beta-galactosidase